MESIDQKNGKFAINKIDDGKIFEDFGLGFIGSVLGYEFIPIGGTKDKGIDGLHHIFTRKGFQKVIYQLSTEKDYEEKIHLSIEKLLNNKIVFDNFTYVTNRHITNETLTSTMIRETQSAIVAPAAMPPTAEFIPSTILW